MEKNKRGNKKGGELKPNEVNPIYERTSFEIEGFI